MNDDSGSSTITQRIAEGNGLDVHLTEDLKPNIQCVRSAAKVRSVTRMVNRNFKRPDKQDFLLIYDKYMERLEKAQRAV